MFFKLTRLRKISYSHLVFLVGVAQLVEHWIVAPVVEGSSPFTHPIQARTMLTFHAQLARQTGWVWEVSIVACRVDVVRMWWNWQTR